ncbi:MAG: hypothetical protein ACI97A_004070 [Planctomycetota bacterium]|jgi:hypothetical protein
MIQAMEIPASDDGRMKREDSDPKAKEAYSAFGVIPGVGKSISLDLWDLGMRSLDDVAQGDPELMFEVTKELAGGQMDRCILYVYRCAVAFANDPNIDSELRKWWNWKD